MRTRTIRCLVAWVLVVIAGCTQPGSTEDAAQRVAQEFGIPRERILSVAEELGVQIAEIETFGPGPFPYNYYQRRFEQFTREHGRPPTRSEVDRMVKGYVAKCIADPYGIEFIFYSERVHPSWITREIAMVFEVVFQLPSPGEESPEDPIFAYMRPIDLRDGSVNPPQETYWEECIQDYLSGH